MKLSSFHSEKGPEFIMSRNRAVYQTNEPNECQGCEDQFVAGVFFKGETFLCQTPVPHRNEPTQTVHGVSGAI